MIKGGLLERAAKRDRWRIEEMRGGGGGRGSRRHWVAGGRERGAASKVSILILLGNTIGLSICLGSLCGGSALGIRPYLLHCSQEPINVPNLHQPQPPELILIHTHKVFGGSVPIPGEELSVVSEAERFQPGVQPS